MEEQEETMGIDKKICKQIEEQMQSIYDDSISPDNIHYLYELVDIHKDLANEKYWKEKIDTMRYGNYGRGRSRDSRGRYSASGYNDGGYNDGGYGRRGVPGSGRGRYRGEEMLDDVYEAYRDYSESSSYGEYGTQENMQKIEIMAESLMDFVEHLKSTAKSPEEKQFIERKIQELGQM